jgi:hypothetical protein
MQVLREELPGTPHSLLFLTAFKINSNILNFILTSSVFSIIFSLFLKIPKGLGGACSVEFTAVA